MSYNSSNTDVTNTSEHRTQKPDIIRDICLWRRKKVSSFVVLISTVTWVLLNVYHYNFITISSWAAMAITTLLFLWGNLLRILSKQEPELSGLEVSEEFVIEKAGYITGIIEEIIKLMFDVSVEREWFVFVASVAGLGLISYLATFFELQTLLYIGTMASMTIPVIYVNHEERIKAGGEKMKEKSKSVYEKVNDKVMKGVKNKFNDNIDNKKEKKIE